MTPKQLEKVSEKLTAFIAMLTKRLGHAGREQPMKDYVTGLLLDGKGKSMEPMAARLVEEPDDQDAMRQRLQHHVTVSNWDDDVVREELATHVDAEMSDIEAFVIDDTGFAKKGEHSVGVAPEGSPHSVSGNRS